MRTQSKPEVNMKKIICLFFLIFPFIFAQQTNNGNISLVFNNEKIDLPVNSITLTKNGGIVLSIEAVKQDSNFQQFVSVELELNSLSSEPNAESLEGTKIIIITRDNKTDSGKELAMSFKDDEFIESKNKFEKMYFGIYNKGEKISWGITSVSLKIDITSVKYENEILHISGKFNGTFKSNAAPQEQTVELENGEFNIIF